MIYILLLYIVGQLAYHHVYAAILIGIILLVSMMIKRQTMLVIFIGCTICLLGYYVETLIPIPQPDIGNAGNQQTTDAPLNAVIHIDSLLIKKDSFYSATGRVHEQSYRLIIRDLTADTRRYNARFLATHVCKIDGTIKAATDHTQVPALFVQQLDLTQCTPYHNQTLSEWIMMIRNTAIERLIDSQIPGYPYIIALVTGTTDYIPFVQKQLLKDLGISHLFAVSGTHVGILTGLLYMIGKRLPIPLYITQLFLLALLPMFLIFSGNSPSAQRAVVMACLVIIFARFIKDAALHILLLSYLCLSFYDPSIRYHVGFQFSYAICFLLITLRNTYLHQTFFRAMITTSFISVLGTIPISYQHFNELQWLGLVSNLFFIPLYGICIIPLSFLATFLALIAPNILWLFTYPFMLLFSIHKFFIVLLTPLTYWKLILPAFGEIGYLMMMLFVAIAAYLLAKRRRKMLLLWIVVALCTVILCHPQYENRMTLIDVGQGDAILFETQTGETLLIDTGGTREDPKRANQKFNITDQKLYPLLKKRGIRHIDYLVITHPHADHMGELAHLANRVDIGNIIINPSHFNQPYARLVRNVRQQERAQVWDYQQLSHLKLGDFSFQFLDSDIASSDDPNEHSIVTLATINKTTMMLMGDATTENEEKLITSYSLPKVDILKVGHHGSKTSSSESFLDTIEPKIALISVAKHNMYHLPSPMIIERFKTYHIPVYTTADNHHVVVTFNAQAARGYTLTNDVN